MRKRYGLFPESVQRECHSEFGAYHHEGERSQMKIRYIVLHSTEGGTAKSVAEYFTTPASGGSANIVVDDYQCYRSCADTIIPWGAPPLNANGFHIEQCGYAAWTRNRWLLHRPMIRRAAYKAALRMRWYNIPARILDAEELIKDFVLPSEVGHIGVQGTANPLLGPMHGGIVTHKTISQAYHESTHVDPGDGYPLDLFLKLVKAFLK